MAQGEHAVNPMELMKIMQDPELGTALGSVGGLLEALNKMVQSLENIDRRLYLLTSHAGLEGQPATAQAETPATVSE